MIATLLYYLRLIYLFIDGSTLKGIRYRTLFSVIVTMVAIITDATCVYYVYDQIPQYIPAAFDWDFNVVEQEDKFSFWIYEIERVIILIILLAIGFFFTWKHPQSLIAKRTRCLLAETAMLIITTGIGISMAELLIEVTKDKTEQISDYWEFSIMIIWFAISLAEYISDYKKLKKRTNQL